MAYNKDIPRATDRIKSSQNDLLQNSGSISTLIKTDHINFDAASGNQGKHNVVSMPNFVDDPVGPTEPTAAADEIKLFTKAVAGITQLFVLPEIGDVGFTAERNITGATRNDNGETTLPSGIKIKWGRNSTPAGGTLQVVFANAFASIYTVSVTIARIGGLTTAATDQFIRVYNFTTANFDVVGWRYTTIVGTRQPTAAFFHWYAIGV